MKKFVITALLATPMLVAAQDLENLDTLLGSIGGLVDTAIPIVVALALLAFFWGLMKFIFNANNEDAKEEGKRIMIWGVVAFFVMVSVWGLVAFIQNALDVETGSAPDIDELVPGDL